MWPPKEAAEGFHFHAQYEGNGRDAFNVKGRRPVIGEEYRTIVFMEGAGFHTLQGVAKIGKGCDKISGDTFLMTELPGGKEGVVLSDGMGSGESALRKGKRNGSRTFRGTSGGRISAGNSNTYDEHCLVAGRRKSAFLQ